MGQINKINEKLSVIAYYLSKFEKEAIAELGYKNITRALDDISEQVGTGNQYLKRRRDEFDVLTNSHRKGQNKRLPNKGVLAFHNELKDIGFLEFTKTVKEIISGSKSEKHDLKNRIAREFSQQEIDDFINRKDCTSRTNKVLKEVAVRVFNPRIIDDLKELYDYKCQICGNNFGEIHDTQIVEAHHIIPYAISQNNDASNIIILCPNHHRIFHKASPAICIGKGEIQYKNGAVEKIALNLHLRTSEGL